MKFLPRILLASCCLLAASSGLADTRTFRVATADTVLTVRADHAAPSVVTLSNPEGAAWPSEKAQRLITKVEVDGTWEAVHWQFESAEPDGHGKGITLVYTSSRPRLRLDWKWRARASAGPIEHSIRIENLGTQPISVPLQDSFDFDWQFPASQSLHLWWIEKGAGRPSDMGTHDVGVTGAFNWQGTSSTYARDGANPREAIPWMLVETTGPKPSGWYAGIEFSGRTRLTLSREGSSLSGELGLDPSPGPFLTRVAPGGSFTPPTVFLGAFSGDRDAAGNILRRWIMEVLLDSRHLADPSYPLLVANSWGSGMEINEQKARAMIQDGAKLGIDMFHLDAGWFRGVGDWQPHPQKFPQGIAALSAYAHQMGLKFGLWIDWTQAGVDTFPGALNVHDPKIHDWLTRDPPVGWKPEAFKGITIDVGYPPARQWCARELDRLVSTFHLDMLEHDGYLVAEGCVRKGHPHVACGDLLGPEPWLDGSCSTDVSYHATLAYYELYSQLRRKYPHLLLEACNDGGRMVDFGTAAHIDYFSITDTYDPLSNRRAFYDASAVLPASMLECYLEKYPAAHLGNFVYMLRSGMMGWCTLMQDTTAWTPEQHAAARREFELYKARLRPLIRRAHLFHISPRPDSVHWDGMEYFDPQTGKGVVYAFRGSTPGESTHSYVLEGLRRDRQYDLHFEDGSSPDRTASGAELMNAGLHVSLSLAESSELVFITERMR